jgi:hypothetical protein
MYINAKLILVETVLGIGGVGKWRRAVDGVNSSTIYLIHCKNLCKCYNVPPPRTTKTKRMKKKKKIGTKLIYLKLNKLWNFCCLLFLWFHFNKCVSVCLCFCTLIPEKLWASDSIIALFMNLQTKIYSGSRKFKEYVA